MPADPRLAALRALRKLAEEWAMRHHALLRYRLASPTQSGGSPWGDLDARYQEVAIEAEMDRLGDLRYPEARDAVARLVAEAMGLDTDRGILFVRNEDGEWEMGGPGQALIFSPSFTGDPRRSLSGFRGTSYYPAPWLADITDPAEALTLIALHVLGSPDAHR